MLRPRALSDHCYFYVYCSAVSTCSGEISVVYRPWLIISRGVYTLEKLCKAGRVCPRFLENRLESGTCMLSPELITPLG